MAAELEWMLIRDHNCFLVRRNGVVFSQESANLARKHSFKYSGLAQKSVLRVEAGVNGGVAISHRFAKAPSNKVAKTFTTPVVVKKTASGPHRAVKVANYIKSTGIRPDLTRAVQARLCSLLAAGQPRPKSTGKLRAEKLAKLTKKN